jgi:phosphonate transport system substrate-binding protein
MRRVLAWFTLLVVGLLFAGCESEGQKAASDPNPVNKAEVIRIAIVPSEDAEKMAEGFEPIREQLAKDTGAEVEVIKLTSYGSAIEAMRSGKVEVAWFGPLSMVLAKQEAGAVPFAIPEIEGKGVSYHSLLLVKADSPYQAIADVKGKKIALVDPGSTSGNLIPRDAVMEALSMTAEEAFSAVTYAGSHDAALLALESGSVDVSAVQDITFDAKVKDGSIKATDYRVIYKSADLPPSPLAHRKDINPALLEKVKTSFMTMHEKKITMDVPGQGNVARFLEADFSKYEPIETMAKRLKLTKSELGK